MGFENPRPGPVLSLPELYPCDKPWSHLPIAPQLDLSLPARLYNDRFLKKSGYPKNPGQLLLL